jgi:hypothetical protein
VQDFLLFSSEISESIAGYSAQSYANSCKIKVLGSVACNKKLFYITSAHCKTIIKLAGMVDG